MNILSGFKPIRAFVLDVDGVLTDGTLILLDDGQMARKMNIKDGYALQLAIKKGYHIVIISGGDSESVRLRLQKLGVTDIHMKITDKRKLLEQYTSQHQLLLEQVLFMGDDIPDMAAMEAVGLPCCPADAVSEIKSIAHYISPANGGYGCVRDVIEKVLKLNGHWGADETISSR